MTSEPSTGTITHDRQLLLERPFFIPLTIFIAGLILYTLTLAPGLLWGGGDFATYQTKAYLGIIENDGIFGHPLWVLLAHAFTWLPIRDPAWRANFASAVFGAISLVLIYLSAYRVTRSQVASALAVGALAVSHTFWTYAVMPKVYSLNCLLLALCIYLLLLWREKHNDIYLGLFAFVYGLSFLNHIVMAVSAAGFIVFILIVLWSRRAQAHTWLVLGLIGVCFIAGLAPYLYMTFQQGNGASNGSIVLGFLTSIYYPFVHPRVLLSAIQWGVLLGIYQYPVTVLAGLAGLYVLWRQDRNVFWLIALSIFGTFLFLFAAADPAAGNVYVWNLHYYLQAYVPFAIAIAAGIYYLWKKLALWRWQKLALTLVCIFAVPVAVYAISPTLVRYVWSDVPDFRPLPGRDNFTYVLSPWKQNETGARTFGEQILQQLPGNSTLFADYSIWTIINYMQIVEHARPDVTLVELTTNQVDTINQHRSQPNLFMADTYQYYDIDNISKSYDIVPHGTIYQLIPK